MTTNDSTSGFTKQRRLLIEHFAETIDNYYFPAPNVKPSEAHHAMKTALDDMIAAFGGCLVCWGRGFGIVLSDEEIPFCECRRGQALKQLWESKDGK